MQAAARRRYLPYGEFVGILYHEAEMLACKGIFAQPSNCTATRKCIKRQSRPDFAQGKIPSILNHEVKMLACKGISALPSNWSSRAKARKRHSRSDFAAGKIPSIFNHEVKMLACKGIFTRPSMSHRAAICRTGGAPPPILAIRQVSWEYYTTKRKCVLAQTFSRGRQLRSRAKARKRQSRYDFAYGKIPAHIITYPPLYCKLFLLCNSPCGLDTVNNSSGDAHRKLPPVHRVAKARCFLRI